LQHLLRQCDGEVSRKLLNVSSVVVFCISYLGLHALSVFTVMNVNNVMVDIQDLREEWLYVELHVCAYARSFSVAISVKRFCLELKCCVKERGHLMA
jgi:hypothetical protein